MKDETVLFNPRNGRFCVLNKTAAFIWNQLEEPRSSTEICAALAANFAGAASAAVRADVSRALDELQDAGCVTDADLP
jgi:PqqD family protein of HPr-rel-A system